MSPYCQKHLCLMGFVGLSAMMFVRFFAMSFVMFVGLFAMRSVGRFAGRTHVFGEKTFVVAAVHDCAVASFALHARDHVALVLHSKHLLAPPIYHDL